MRNFITRILNMFTTEHTPAFLTVSDSAAVANDWHAVSEDYNDTVNVRNIL